MKILLASSKQLLMIDVVNLPHVVVQHARFNLIFHFVAVAHMVGDSLSNLVLTVLQYKYIKTSWG